ncbi:MAG TPA: hypothetical protein VND65_17950, partial [Candidatus Binatia bacterium]|nr:hypothetical protein [Candidatus Binatia bacterium]
LAEEKLTARDKEISSLQRDMKAAGARIEKLLEEQGKKVVIDVKAGSSPNIPAVDQKRTAAVPPERGAIVAHRPPGSGNGHGDLTPYQVDMLRGLIELEAMGRMEPPWSLAGAASGKSASSSTFEKYAANLKAKGLIEYPTSGRMRLTDAGRAAAPAVVDFPSLEEIQERTLKLLTPYQADLLRVLIQAGTEPLSWDDLASQSGKQATSSTFEKYMASLRSMEFIEYTGPKRAKAASWLVE